MKLINDRIDGILKHINLNNDVEMENADKLTMLDVIKEDIKGVTLIRNKERKLKNEMVKIENSTELTIVNDDKQITKEQFSKFKNSQVIE